MSAALDPTEGVRLVCERWHELDPATMAGLFTVDAEYRNMPLRGAVRGRAAIAEVFDTGRPHIDRVEVQLRTLASDGDVVFAERLETIHPRGGQPICVPVVGVFELRGGAIAAWRDYYDGPLLAPLQRLLRDAAPTRRS